jgi:hypothetical protein
MEKTTSKIKANEQKNTLLKTAASQRCETKFLREYFFLLPQKNYFLKSPSLLKIFKTATAQPIHKDQNTHWTMTAKPLTDMTYTTQQTERQLVTAVWQKWRCSASYDSFVGKQTLVLRLKFGAENRHLRQAANRWLLL